MNLFQSGDFTLHSGKKSNWKIECDALTKEDWDTLALIALELLPKFGEVVGVPRGGILFADALRKYITPGSKVLLVAEDVCTTGNSMDCFIEDNKDKYSRFHSIIGVCVFASDRIPGWITSLFVKNREIAYEKR